MKLATMKRIHSNLLFPLVVLLVLISASGDGAQAQRRKRAEAAPAPAKSLAIRTPLSITVRTEPGAIVWLDEVRRGLTDASGQLTLTNVMTGRHSLRVRAGGFKETTTQVAPARRGEIAVKLVRTTDEAELTFQQAESAREKARDEEARKAAAALYNRALELCDHVHALAFECLTQSVRA